MSASTNTTPTKGRRGPRARRPSPALTRSLQGAQRAVDAAERQAREREGLRWDLVQAAQAEGVSARQLARVLGVSRQRARAIAHAERPSAERSERDRRAS